VGIGIKNKSIVRLLDLLLNNITQAIYFGECFSMMRRFRIMLQFHGS